MAVIIGELKFLLFQKSVGRIYELGFKMANR